MPSSFTATLGLEKQATGENSGTWGSLLNDNLDDLDTAICGYLAKSVAGSSDVTLTSAEALNATLEFTGALTGNINVIVPTKERIQTFYNNTSGSYTLTVKTSAGTGIAITQGKKAVLYCDGTNVLKLIATDDVPVITGLTEDTAPDGTADYLAEYDASATSMKKLLLNNMLKIINSLTADASPDVAADYLASYDASASGPKKVLLSTILALVNGLTEDTSPDESADFMLMYDTSASAAKKVKPSNLEISIAKILAGTVGAVGFSATDYNAGTKSSGTYTPDPANGNFQYAVNGGAHTLAPPATSCTMVIQYTNNGSAGTITTSGFTKVTGSFTTTNGDDFMCFVTRLNGFSSLNIVALQ